MRGYFYILLLTSVCGGICSLMSWGGYEKYIKYIAAMICVLMMISPFRDIDITEIPNGEYFASADVPNENLLYTTAESITEENVKKYISQVLFNKFGIKDTTVNIKIDWDREDPTIESITVIIPKGNSSPLENIKIYMAETLGGEVNLIEE